MCICIQQRVHWAKRNNYGMEKVNKTMNGFEDGPGRDAEGREIDCSCSSRREWTKRRRRRRRANI